MSALKNHKTARIIMVILIVSSLFLGSSRSLRSLVRSAEDIFYNGATGNGVGIAYDISGNLDIAYNMQTVAGRYLTEKDSTLKALASAITDLEKAETIPQLKKGNEAITKSLQAVSEKLVAMDLSDTDLNYCVAFVSNLDESNRRMPRDAYNEAAEQVNEVLKTFPASLLRLPAGVKSLVVFS